MKNKQVDIICVITVLDGAGFDSRTRWKFFCTVNLK